MENYKDRGLKNGINDSLKCKMQISNGVQQGVESIFQGIDLGLL